ncbi:MAG TPA: hypothetical protein VF176_10335 [Solirubrobacterales bacterium]
MRPAEYLQRADAAVVGRLIAVTPRGQLRADYRYRLKRVYGGGDGLKRGQILVVRSARQTAACALPRHRQKTYGLFLAYTGQRWTAGICGVIAPRRLWAVARSHSAGAGGSAGVSSCAS